ncbi:hypothetical protein HYO62_10205 [Aerococcaceae bacterium DSM 111022]|nr:hypothetical protein [Aerococcaceae bacterium DSM 111022]
MKKFKWIILLIMVSQLMITGIFDSLVVAETGEESNQIVLEAYQDVIDEVYDTQLKTIIEYNYPTPFYYALYDVDQNGVEELLLTEGGLVKSIYTYDQATDQVVYLEDASGNFTVRDVIMISNDGYIYQELVGGASLSEYRTYRIALDGVSTELVGHYVFDLNGNEAYPYYEVDNPSQRYTADEFSEVINHRWTRGSQADVTEYTLYPITTSIVMTQNPSPVVIDLTELESIRYRGSRIGESVSITFDTNGQIIFTAMDDNVFLYDVYDIQEKEITVSRSDGTEMEDQVSVISAVLPTEMTAGYLEYYLNEEMYLYYNFNGQLSLAVKDFQNILFGEGDDGVYLEFILEADS